MFHITRFNVKYLVEVLAVYKKGKKGKLSVDNIRFVIKPSNFYENSFCTNLFCLPAKPEYDQNSPMYDGTCLMSNLPMKLRPEFIGDLDIITINVDTEQSHFKSKAYNYYKEDINSPEVQKVIEQMIESIECFSK